MRTGMKPFLFNLSLEKIIQETPHDHHTSIFIGGRLICATYNLPTTSILCSAAVVNFKISPRDSLYSNGIRKWSQHRKE